MCERFDICSSHFFVHSADFLAPYNVHKAIAFDMSFLTKAIILERSSHPPFFLGKWCHNIHNENSPQSSLYEVLNFCMNSGMSADYLSVWQELLST